MASAEAHVEGQQHPIGIYFKIWALLFVLSLFSYLVDFYHLQGNLRWSLNIIIMLLKAGLIVAVFMHMMWERMAMVCAIILPTTFIIVFIFLMTHESDYTFALRDYFFIGGGA